VDGIQLGPPSAAQRPVLDELLARSWGGPLAVAHGTVYDLPALPAVVAVHSGRIVGGITYRAGHDGLELTSVDAFTPRRGIGTALVGAPAAEARRRGLDRVWCTTTNDNLDALRFYQRRGFRLVALRPGAVDDSAGSRTSRP
jgi:ribosomal protein S18 acetylase RimI-like enzyme